MYSATCQRARRTGRGARDRFRESDVTLASHSRRCKVAGGICLHIFGPRGPDTTVDQGNEQEKVTHIYRKRIRFGKYCLYALLSCNDTDYITPV
jgi:hypothetical protein